MTEETQEIIAIGIVIFTFIYAIYKIYQSITTKEKSICGNCSCGSKKDMFKKIKGSSKVNTAEFNHINTKMTLINNKLIKHSTQKLIAKTNIGLG